MPAIRIDYFHDVVCCWSFNISSRMRILGTELDLDIRHRNFVLQDGDMGDDGQLFGKLPVDALVVASVQTDRQRARALQVHAAWSLGYDRAASGRCTCTSEPSSGLGNAK